MPSSTLFRTVSRDNEFPDRSTHSFVLAIRNSHCSSKNILQLPVLGSAEFADATPRIRRQALRRPNSEDTNVQLESSDTLVFLRRVLGLGSQVLAYLSLDL